jgi:hypothetical protein
MHLILPQNVIDEIEEEKRVKEEALRKGRYDVHTRTHYDPDSDRLTVERVQDAEPALDFAQAMRTAHPRNGYSEGRELRHVAEIPLVIWEKWVAEGMNPNDNAELRRRLADPEYKKLWTVDKL